MDSSLLRDSSWVVVSRATGEVVMETFSPAVCAAINIERYQVIPILEWLGGFNRAVAYAAEAA